MIAPPVSCATNQPPFTLRYAGMKTLLPRGISRGSTASVRYGRTLNADPLRKRMPEYERWVTPRRFDQPPRAVWKVTAPRRLRQPPSNQTGRPLLQWLAHGPGNVGAPAR